MPDKKDIGEDFRSDSVNNDLNSDNGLANHIFDRENMIIN